MTPAEGTWAPSPSETPTDASNHATDGSNRPSGAIGCGRCDAYWTDGPLTQADRDRLEDRLPDIEDQDDGPSGPRDHDEATVT